MESMFRAHGCRITEFSMQSMRCLTLENELIRMTLLLDKGADIIEFRHKASDVDFLWRSPSGLRAPQAMMPTQYSQSGNYLDFYEGGWQELFPTIGDPCTYKGAELGIHSEACLLPWKCRIERDCEDEVSVLLTARMMRMPFLLEKRLMVKSGSMALFISERAVNEGAVTMDFMWGHHPALGGPFLDSRVLLDIPAKVGRTFPRSFHPDFPADLPFTWPLLPNGKDALDIGCQPAIPGKWAGICHAHELRQGWCTATNPALGLGFGLVFDKAVFPNVWLWMVYNGLPDYPWYGRTRCLAMEPYSSVPDNLPGAIAAKTTLRLQPGEELTTSLTAVCYESTGRVAGVDADGTVLLQ